MARPDPCCQEPTDWRAAGSMERQGAAGFLRSPTLSLSGPRLEHSRARWSKHAGSRTVPWASPSKRFSNSSLRMPVLVWPGMALLSQAPKSPFYVRDTFTRLSRLGAKRQAQPNEPPGGVCVFLQVAHANYAPCKSASRVCKAASCKWAWNHPHRHSRASFPRNMIRIVI